MKSLRFPQANVAVGKDQPQYETLYAHVDPSCEEVPVTSCFELTDEEVEEIVRTRCIWSMQMTYGCAFQPIRMSTQNPFAEVVDEEVPHG